MERDPQSQRNTISDANEASEQRKEDKKKVTDFVPRSSLESTATTLPRYSQQIDRPPAYNSQTKSRTAASTTGANAAAISAILATSSSDTDKMHSKRSSKKVDDWSRDDTYKGKLSRMTGSSSKWNYFGADIEQYGNPFERLRRKK